MPINFKILHHQGAHAPRQLMPWLEHVQSLTAKLKHIAKDASLEVLSQHVEPSDEWDHTVLGLANQLVIHREIVMSAWEVPCWYARTILPMDTFNAHQLLFDRLKTETLGDLIFSGTDIKRMSITHFRVDDHSITNQFLTPELRQHEEQFWARLSEFSVRDKESFFLLEILLPGLMRYAL